MSSTLTVLRIRSSSWSFDTSWKTGSPGISCAVDDRECISDNGIDIRESKRASASTSLLVRSPMTGSVFSFWMKRKSS